ncbi:hypothetical protein [Streptomyces sp. NPDC059491]|uniref:hypothetical protein n=1 Tax=Streptomyces sp. NPDC059491 TaxID=3346850 RepID=UPI00368D529A
MTATPRTTGPTALDGPIEQTVGDLAGLHHDHHAGLLSEDRAALASAHRDLGVAETAVAYHRNVLMQLSSGAHVVDDALLDRMRRTLRDLARAVADRDEKQARAAAALERVRTSAPPTPAISDELTAHDLAALLSLAAGGTVREHLHTHRVSVRTTQGRLVDYMAFQRLEHHGLVAIDTSRDLIVGQLVTLTDAGRSTLIGSRHPAQQKPAAPVRPAGAWPVPARSR